MTNMRQANPDDVQGIAAVMKNAFNEDIDQTYCRDLLAGGEYIVRVAVAGEHIMGLVAGFLTSTSGMVRRWEVDLLAVHSDHQGNGLGTQLVEAAWTDAEAHQVKFARGLTRIENEAAKTCFARAGFTTSGAVFNMIQWQPSQFEVASPSRSLISLLPVETLTYRGVWVEGLDNVMVNDDDREKAIKAARSMAFHENRDNVSALFPVDKPLSAEVIGQYQWWRRP